LRSPTASIALAALATSALVALACGPSEETTVWSLDHKDYSDNSGLPLLSPGNDTRVNLQLLMASPERTRAATAATDDDDSGALFSLRAFEAAYQDGIESRYASAWDDGTRCQSQKSGAEEFGRAVAAATGLTDAERALLVEARTKLLPLCDKAGANVSQPLRTTLGSSPTALAFATYLAGVEAFYLGAFDEAATAFASLADASDPWLRETARYMTARTALNKAQLGVFDTFDMVGQPKVSDTAALVAAETAFRAYLDAFPAGRYRASAQGLLRRVHWLGGDKARLAGEYGRLIAAGVGKRDGLSTTDLAREIDTKILGGLEPGDAPALAATPVLLAVDNLRRMRTQPQAGTEFTASALEAQAPAFATQPALFGFLKAARAYYVDKDPDTALAALGPAPADPGPLATVAFSREMLRGQALLAKGPTDATAAHWRALLPRATEPWQKEAVELGLAVTWEKLGTINKAFLPETRIDSERIRAILLQQVAGPILLRMAMADPKSSVAEQDLARDVLLFKEATRGQYANFLRDYDPDALQREGMPRSKSWIWDGKGEPYPCPDIKAVVAGLASNPRSPAGQLCLAEFVRAMGHDGREDKRPPPHELGGSKSIFPGEPYARLEVYRKLIADNATPARDKAYALYRAVNCYAPTSINQCGGPGVPKGQREAWFRTLKTKYGSTPWARELKYYW
jgi:hypothetical protein